MRRSISLIGLSEAERLAFDKIREIISLSDLPPHNFDIGRTERYLTVSSEGAYPFCNLRLADSLSYIELCIGDPDDIERLSSNPLYFNLRSSSKKFTRFIISHVDDIEKYSEGVVSACRWINPSFRIRRVSPPGKVGLSSESEIFFGNMESYSKSSRKYTLSDDEVSFFEAYIEKLIANGLNWKNALSNRSSDGAIVAPGGWIKLQGRKTAMSYNEPGKSLFSTVENLTLPEYIALQRHWISECLENRDIYSL